MRKIIYLIFLLPVIIGIVGFVKIQQLRDVDFSFSNVIDLVGNKNKIDLSGSSTKYPHGRNAVRKSNIMQIFIALDKYVNETGCSFVKSEVNGSITGTGIFSADMDLNPIVPEYIPLPLKDPINNSSYYYSYIYSGDNFIVFARLEPLYDEVKTRYYCIDSFTNRPIIVFNNPSLNLKCN